jgi:hypothetical protein
MRIMSALIDSGHAHSNMLCCDFDTRDLTVWKSNRRKVHNAAFCVSFDAQFQWIVYDVRL